MDLMSLTSCRSFSQRGRNIGPSVWTLSCAQRIELSCYFFFVLGSSFLSNHRQSVISKMCLSPISYSYIMWNQAMVLVTSCETKPWFLSCNVIPSHGSYHVMWYQAMAPIMSYDTKPWFLSRHAKPSNGFYPPLKGLRSLIHTVLF